MGDLKLISKTKEELQKQKQAVITFIIHMGFGLDKRERLYSKEKNLFFHKIECLTSTEKYKSLNREKHTSI
jgi:hypothetical protein